jgi:hypothetical protein
MPDNEIKQRHKQKQEKEPVKKVDEEDTKKLQGTFC